MNFDLKPITLAAIGGAILGLTTSINYLIRGKVTGMSGIFATLISGTINAKIEKITMLGGMMVAATLVFLQAGYGQFQGFTPFGPEKQIAAWANWKGFLIAGFLVGFGTKLSNGCTSGHGLCGLPRLSLRSFIAVLLFLITGLIVGTYAYHSKGLLGLVDFNQPQQDMTQIAHHKLSAQIFLVIGLILPSLGLLLTFFTKCPNNMNIFARITDQILTFAVGFMFALGLMVAGMSRRLYILRFLQLGQLWQPALLFVLGSGLLINFIGFQSALRFFKSPVLGKSHFNPQNQKIDWKLIVGAIAFGAGWGIGGICPGPFVILASIGIRQIQYYWGGAFIAGMLIARIIEFIQQPFLSKQKKPKSN